MRVLLLSNSTLPGTDFFTWPQPYVKEFLGDRKLNLVFVPFAAVAFSFDEYSEKVTEVFNRMGYSIQSLHDVGSKKAAIEHADGIVVGGGNTFALLSRIYEFDLLELIRTKVQNGAPYIGWSAGANLACPTIMTTNDMPVVEPPSLRALDLVPFQINPHYHELKFEGQGGETRKERLEEFIEMNPGLAVIGLPEGMFVQRTGNTFTIGGDPERVVKVYQAGRAVLELRSGMELDLTL